ncbi:MAG: DUF433 domain-containing protein, partial [Bacteroidota bacterium]
MHEKDLLSRITINPNISLGKPTIRNMRYPVEIILDLLSAGMSTKEILEDYPDLEEQDILACIAFVAKLLRVKSMIQIKAA